MSTAGQLVFGKYELRQRLATGGMSQVFYSLDKSAFDRPVALKALPRELADDESLVRQFLDEGRVIAKLNHPNIVSIYEVGEWEGTCYLAMEYVRGLDLTRLQTWAAQQKRLFPAAAAGRFIRDAAAGLHHAHTATDEAGAPLGIVHRDVNPRNLMVRDDGVVKVVDFGIARSVARTSPKTATGFVKGTLGYLAPEQFSSVATPRSDQYALGIVLWELLVGQRLFPTGVNGVVPAPSSLAGEQVKPYEALVLRMLDPRPEQRFASCAEVAEALDEAARESPSADASGMALLRGLDAAAFLKSSRPAKAQMVLQEVRSRHTEATPVIGARTTAPRAAFSVIAFVAAVAGLLTMMFARPAPKSPPPTHVISASAPNPPPSAPLPVVAPLPPPLDAGQTPGALVRPTRAPAPPTPVADGFLTLDTKPWTKVWVDGERRGVVPLSHVRLAAGRHTLLLVNEEASLRVTRQVEVAPTQSVKLLLDLRPGVGQ